MTDVQNMKSTLTYDDKVIEKIVGHALENVDGLLAVSGGFFSNLKNNLVNSDSVTDGVSVEVGTKEVAVDLNIVVEYGKDIPAIVEGIKAIVAQNVAVMTHLKVVELNANVVDIRTKEEHEKASVTVQDRMTEAAHATGEFASSSAEKIKEATAAGVEKTKEALEKEGRVLA
ncbi:Asp23/Gls24 family envelope stress response protein [Streptococcus cameli]